LVKRVIVCGFALIAYPAKHRYSGVMTFIVNQSGVVYERDGSGDIRNPLACKRVQP
jgi:hypothetical protein